MAAATPGDIDGVDGGGVDRDFLPWDSDGESEGWGGGGVAVNSAPSPAQAAAARFAKVVHASPSKSSHRFASSFGGGIELVPSLLTIFFSDLISRSVKLEM